MRYLPSLITISWTNLNLFRITSRPLYKEEARFFQNMNRGVLTRIFWSVSYLPALGFPSCHPSNPLASVLPVFIPRPASGASPKSLDSWKKLLVLREGWTKLRISTVHISSKTSPISSGSHRRVHLGCLPSFLELRFIFAASARKNYEKVIWVEEVMAGHQNIVHPSIQAL